MAEKPDGILVTRDGILEIVGAAGWGGSAEERIGHEKHKKQASRATDEHGFTRMRMQENANTRGWPRSQSVQHIEITVVAI